LPPPVLPPGFVPGSPLLVVFAHLPVEPVPSTPTPVPQRPSWMLGLMPKRPAVPPPTADWLELQSVVEPVPSTPTPVPHRSAWTLGLTSTRPVVPSPAVEVWDPEQVAPVPLPRTPT